MPAGVFVGTNNVVIMDSAPVVYAHVFHTGSGPDRHIKRKADEVAILAKSLAPKRTGALAASIRVDQTRNELGQYAFGYHVQAGTGYGAYVHEGTGPSVRVAHKMSFWGTNHRLGSRVVTNVVHHPGTPAQPFLEEALVAMVG